MTILTAPRTSGNTDPRKRALTEALAIAANVNETGIVNDPDGARFALVITGGSTVRVAQPEDSCLIRGHFGEADAAEIVDVTSYGPNVASGQQRTDRIVARLTRAAPYPIEIVGIPGPVVTLGSASQPPPIVRSAVAWDLPLYRVRRRGATALTSTDIADERMWVGNTGLVRSIDALLATDALGSFRVLPGSGLWKKDLAGGTAGWRIAVDELPPQVVARTSSRTSHGANAWNYMPLTSAFGTRGPDCVQLGQGPQGRGFRCLIAGDLSIHTILTFDRANVAVRIEKNGDTLAQVDDPPAATLSRTRTLGRDHVPVLVGDIITIEAISVNDFDILQDNGSIEPSLPCKVVFTQQGRA